MADDYPTNDGVADDGIDAAPRLRLFTIETALMAHELFTPPRAGSKGYQRRRNQRWPKGR